MCSQVYLRESVAFFPSVVKDVFTLHGRVPRSGGFTVYGAYEAVNVQSVYVRIASCNVLQFVTGELLVPT